MVQNGVPASCLKLIAKSAEFDQVDERPKLIDAHLCKPRDTSAACFLSVNNLARVTPKCGTRSQNRLQ